MLQIEYTRIYKTVIRTKSDNDIQTEEINIFQAN